LLVYNGTLAESQFPAPFILQGFIFLKKISPGKNRENFGVLHSHNMLYISRLHNGRFLQLTLVRLRRFGWQFFRALAFPATAGAERGY